MCRRCPVPHSQSWLRARPHSDSLVAVAVALKLFRTDAPRLFDVKLERKPEPILRPAGISQTRQRNLRTSLFHKSIFTEPLAWTGGPIYFASISGSDDVAVSSHVNIISRFSPNCSTLICSVPQEDLPSPAASISTYSTFHSLPPSTTTACGLVLLACTGALALAIGKLHYF